MKSKLEYTRSQFTDALEKRVLVYDGANGTVLQAMELSADDFGGERYNGCYDYLAVTSPGIVEDVHRAYYEVGVDVVETNTFRANPITLAEYGLEAQTYEINRAASSAARRVADSFSTEQQPRFVAGSIGPSGLLPSANDPTLSAVTFDELVENFRVQACGLIDGGADVLLIETSQDILEVKATIQGIRKRGIRLPHIRARASRISSRLQFSPPRIYLCPTWPFSSASRWPRATSSTATRWLVPPWDTRETSS